MTFKNSLTFESSRFGMIDYESEDVVRFASGLLGFPHARSFVLICDKPSSPFRWLQCIEDGSLAFLVVPPNVYVRDYAPIVKDDVVESLRLSADVPPLLYAIATIPPGRPEEMTINLAGPVVINSETRQAAQAVVEGEAYTIKHRVFQSERRVGESAAA